MKFLSLFGGVGGFEVGIRKATEDSQNGKYLSKWGRSGTSSIRDGDLPDNQTREERGDASYSDCDESECAGYYEIDKYAVSVYNKNFNTNYTPTDIRTIESFPKCDFIVAGFPCQSFSIAGKRRGFDDTRGTLFYEILRTARLSQPHFLLLENVKGLLSHDKGETFRRILECLDELGFDAEWQVLNSKFFGVPQNRERVFIIGHSRACGKGCGKVFPISNSVEPNFEQGKEFSEQVSNTLRTNYSTAYSNETYIGESKMIQLRGGSQGQRVYSPEGLSQTISRATGGQGRSTGPYMVNLHQKRTGEYGNGIKQLNEASFTLDSGSGRDLTIVLDLYNHKTYSDRTPALTELHHNNLRLMQEKRIRRLTPIECERLQGFSDDWTKQGINEKGEVIEVSDTQRYKMMGNAVTTNVIEAIMKRIVAVFGVEEK